LQTKRLQSYKFSICRFLVKNYWRLAGCWLACACAGLCWLDAGWLDAGWLDAGWLVQFLAKRLD
jgi:hypothetical protein